MIQKTLINIDGSIMNVSDDTDKLAPSSNSFCRDYIRGCCTRENCRYIHELPPKTCLKELFRFCHDFQNKGCYRNNCKFIHSTVEEEDNFYRTGMFPRDPRNTPVCQAYIRGACSNQECKLVHPPDVVGNEVVPVLVAPPPLFNRPPPPIRDEDSPPEAKFRRFAFDDNSVEKQVLAASNLCPNCDSLDHKVKLLHDNIRVLLKKVADLSEKNVQLTSMNEFLLEQTASVRTDQSCVITSRHGPSAPVSLATVSVTPVVSLAGALPALVPAAATPNIALAPAASRAQLLTPAPQILTVSTTQQLVGNPGALIVTSAGAQQLMQVSDSGTLMGTGQTVVVTPAQLTLAPPAQQLMGNAPQTAVQQLVQQSALQPQVVPQHQAPQFAVSSQVAQQSAVQHLAVQQSAQHLAAQQSAQHLAAQQSAQHLAAQQSAQHLAAQQSAQHLAAQQSAQHLAAAQQSAQHLAAAQQSAQHLAAAQQSAQQQLAAAAQQSAQQMVAQQSAQQLAAQQSAQQQLVPSAQQLVHQTSTQQITISSTSQPMALPNSQAQPITFPMISQSILPH